MIFKLFFGIGIIYSIFEDFIMNFKSDSVSGFISGSLCDLELIYGDEDDISLEDLTALDEEDEDEE